MVKEGKNQTAADVVGGINELTGGISREATIMLWREAEHRARILLDGGRPSATKKSEERRALAVSKILELDGYEQYRDMLMNVEKEVLFALKRESTPEKVQDLVNQAKAMGVPTDAIREILPPEVNVKKAEE